MKAYELLSDERKWCQKNSAVDVDGGGVDINSPQAVAWGLNGTLWRCYACDYHRADARARYDAAYRLVVDALRAEGRGTYCGVSAWNDHPSRTYAEVVGLLKRLDI